jgi:rare lipoprotein A
VRVVPSWLAVVIVLLSAPQGAPGDTVRPPGVERNQLGYATYYANHFQGDRTASGERFDTTELVAAHRSLPFGTIVRVTNLENRRSVHVRIVDRGPFGENRDEGAIIDLSRAAARRLAMLKEGQVRVRVRVIKLGRDSER